MRIGRSGTNSGGIGSTSVTIGVRYPATTKGEELKMRRLFFALCAASAVALALIATSAVAAATPFKGTVHAVEANQLVFPVLSVNRTGTGNATYLGKFTEHVTLQVNVTTRS